MRITKKRKKSSISKRNLHFSIYVYLHTFLLENMKAGKRYKQWNEWSALRCTLCSVKLISSHDLIERAVSSGQNSFRYITYTIHYNPDYNYRYFESMRKKSKTISIILCTYNIGVMILQKCPRVSRKIRVIDIQVTISCKNLWNRFSSSQKFLRESLKDFLVMMIIVYFVGRKKIKLLAIDNEFFHY